MMPTSSFEILSIALSQWPAQRRVLNTEKIAKRILPVNSNQRLHTGREVALHQCEMHRLIDVIVVAIQGKFAVCCLHRCFIDSFNESLFFQVG